MATQTLKCTNIQNLPAGQAPYIFTVRALDSNDVIISSSFFQPNQQFTRNSPSIPFVLSPQWAEGTYSINNIRQQVLYKGNVIFTSSPFNVNVNCGSATESPNPFPEITAMAISSAPAGRQFSMYVTSSVLIQSRVQKVGGGAITGLSWLDLPYNENTWIPPDTQWAPPYTYVYRWNGTATGVNGLIPGQTYKFSFRKASDTTKEYYRIFTIPTVDTPLTVIPLQEGGGGATTTFLPGQTTTLAPSVTTTAGPTTTPTPTTTVPSTIVARVYAKSLPEHINMQVTGGPGNWTFNDMGTEFPDIGAGYQFYYMIDSQIIRQNGRLTNYNHKSNNPVCFKVLMTKTDLVTLEELGQGATDRIQHFSRNSTSAFMQFIFS